MYVSFCGVLCSIFGRTSEARDEVWEEADVEHSLRMVEVCATQELDVLEESVVSSQRVGRA